MGELMNSSLARAAPRLEDQAGVVDGTGAGRDRGAAATKVIFDQHLRNCTNKGQTIRLLIIRFEYLAIWPYHAAAEPCLECRGEGNGVEPRDPPAPDVVATVMRWRAESGVDTVESSSCKKRMSNE